MTRRQQVKAFKREAKQLNAAWRHLPTLYNDCSGKAGNDRALKFLAFIKRCRENKEFPKKTHLRIYWNSHGCFIGVKDKYAKR